MSKTTTPRNGLLALLAPILLALALLAGCRNQTLDPVFYALENEKPLTDDRGLEDEATIHRIVQVGNRYFAAAGALFTRTSGADERWSAVAPPVAGALCNTLELFGGQLYAGFVSTGGTGLGLYRFDPDPYPDPVVWEQITDAVDFGASPQLTLLKAAGGELFAAVFSGAAYKLTRSASGDTDTFAEVSWLSVPAAAQPVVDVASNGTGTFWAIVGAKLYRDTGGGFDLPATTTSASRAYGGLFWSSGGTLYLASDNGRLYSSIDDGATWTSSAAILDDDEDPVPFTCFVAPAVAVGDLYAGSRGCGYYRIPGGDVTALADSMRRPSYTISLLYNGAVNTMLYDGATVPESLLIGTSGAGLWRGDWTGSDWLWKQE